MTTYVLRRLLLMIPTLMGITLVVFIAMAASPGGISSQSLTDGQNLDPEARQAIEAYYNNLYGLDDPAPVQYLRWLNNVSPVGFTFDSDRQLDGFGWKGSNLGQSFRYGRSVMDLLAERIPITLLLNLVSIPIIYLIAIVTGVYAATQRGQAFDVVSGGFMLSLWSIPTMLAGVLLLGFFANTHYWHWFPTAGLSSREALNMPFLPHWTEHGFIRGFLLDRLWHLILPVICLSYGGFAALSKLTRTAVLENLRADYARTALAKGVSERQVLWKHVFRNSLMPLITVSSSLLPALLAGSVVVESIFSIEGMGKLAVEAVKTRDRELVLSIALVSGLLTVFGNLLADFLYAWVDPRVSYE